MKQAVLVILGALVAVSAVVVVFAYLQAAHEEIELTADLQYRTRLLSDSLKESVEPSFVNNSTTTLQRIINRFANRERLLGVALFDSNGTPVAASSTVPTDAPGVADLVAHAMDSDTAQSILLPETGGSLFLFVDPLHQDGRVIGAFMVVQNAAYIQAQIRDVWVSTLNRLLIQIVVFVIVVGVLIRWMFYLPLMSIVEAVRAARAGHTESKATILRYGFFTPLANEIAKMTHSLTQARSAASEEARLRLEKIDTPWTAERLKEFVKAYVKKRPIFVVSNREPYVHYMGKRQIQYSVPAHGMVTAVESVMEACGGTWIAHGSGDADREVVDTFDRIRVPPDEPKYTLKRVWLTKEEVDGHYVGFSNEALFPLCHIVYKRPLFKKEDWATYRRVNGIFASRLLEEIRNVENPIVLVQDLHFALVPSMIKKSRPDAEIAIFWHHPWPSAEQFSVCPWRKEILEGILGADIIGFHTQQYCNNFIETIGKELESLIDYEQFSVTHHGHTSYVKPFPISVAFVNGVKNIEEPDRAILNRLGIKTKHLAVGVERMDYIKGLIEKFQGLEELFEAHPQYRGELTLLQIAAPSRESVGRYRQYRERVIAEAQRINDKFATNDWKPIVLENVQYSRAELDEIFRLADVCIITSLHDGMNLVAREFVATRDDEEGVLVLSKFTGSARTLDDALIVNPYSAEEVAAALHTALTMPRLEQRKRMRAMRNAVKNYNVYRWAAELLKAVVDLS